MTAAEFRAELALLGMTQQGFGRLVGVDGRTVQRWALDEGERGIPPSVRLVLRLLRERRVPPPPDALRVEDDRDGPALDAVQPWLDAMLVSAQSAGWHPAEVVTAVASWVAHRAVDAAQDAGTEEAWEAARELGEGLAEVVALERARIAGG